MKLLAFTLTLSAAAALAEPPQASIDLLAGQSLAAWELVAVPPNPAELAGVAHCNADGSLAVIGKPVSYLATRISAENHRLHVEWRWPANAAKNSNGGILLHVTGGPANGTAWPACFQMQLKLGRAGDLLPMNGAKFAEKLSTPPDAKTPQLDRQGTEPRSRPASGISATSSAAEG
jgi:hypothetical protein